MGTPPSQARYGPMLLGSQLPDSPRDIIYMQIRQVLISRSRGSDAAEDMVGLMALIDPWKDEKWDEEMRVIKEERADSFWNTLEAVVRLLSRKNLWATTPRQIEEGKELSQAI